MDENIIRSANMYIWRFGSSSNRSLRRYRVTSNQSKPTRLLCLTPRNIQHGYFSKKDQNQAFIIYRHTVYTYITSSIAASRTLCISGRGEQEISPPLSAFRQRGRSDRVTSVSFPKAARSWFPTFDYFRVFLSCVLALPVSLFSGLGLPASFLPIQS
jgi:hypothetical protein